MLTQLLSVVDRAGPRARLMVAVIAVVTIAAIGYIVYSAQSPAQMAIVSGVDPKTAGEVQTALSAAGIPSDLDQNGTAVTIPAARAAEAQVALAGSSVATGTQADWSLLDSGGMSMTNGQWDMRVLRARSGTLAAQIEEIEGVQSATVNIAMPTQSVFVADQGVTRASVKVDTGANVLSDQAVRGIVALVAGGVPGLTAQNVTVTDQRGTLLTSAMSAIGAQAADRMDATQQWNAQQSAIAQAALDRVLGPGKSTVIVSGMLNFDAKKTTEQTYGENKGAISGSNEQETLEQEGGGAVAPGTNANIPGAAAGSSSGASNYEHTKKDTTNAIDSTMTETMIAGGDPTKMSVALVVDKAALDSVLKGAATDAAQQQTALRSLQATVQNAVGYDADNAQNAISATVVDKMASPDEVLEGSGLVVAAPATPTSSGLIPAPFNELVKPIMAALALLVFAFFVRRSLNRRQALLGTRNTPWMPQLEAAPIRVDELVAALGAPPTDDEVAAVERAQLQGRVERLASDRPDDVASQLRGWIRPE